ncbi:MAG: hypothetical protein ACPGEC_02080 [Flavobacteriales bacterium]
MFSTSRLFILSIALLFSTISCTDKPTYEVEIEVIDFFDYSPVSGVEVKTGAPNADPTKALDELVEQVMFTDDEGKVRFSFNGEANIFFDLDYPSGDKSGKTSIKLKENEVVKKQVYIYPN